MPKTYAFTTRVVTGVGWLSETLAVRVARYGPRGLVVLGRGRAVGAALRSEIMDRLRGEGLQPYLCEGIGPDGRLVELRAAAQEVSTGLDWLLAVGGGSVIDAAKLLSLHQAGRPLVAACDSVEAFAARKSKADRLPVIAVPTCLGSGAEVSPLAEVIDGRGWKEPVVDARMAPAEAWIDPAFAPPPPAPIQAAAVVDLFFNLFDPLISAGHQSDPRDSTAIELCRRLISLVHRVPDLHFRDEPALELAWLGHLAVQPGLTRPWDASVLHRIEHVVAPVLGCSHGEGLAWLAGAFLCRAVERSSEVARRLVDLTAAIFGEDVSPDRAFERWLELLPVARPKQPTHSDWYDLAGRVLKAYGQAERLPGPLAFEQADVETILVNSARTLDDATKNMETTVEAWPVNTVRVFGGAVEGSWDWLLLTPLPYLEEDLIAWRGQWTRGWYPTLRIEGPERGLVVQTSPGGEMVLDALTLLKRAGAHFRLIHFVGLCGSLHLNWSIGTAIRPTLAWGDRSQRSKWGSQPVALSGSTEGDAPVSSGICGSLSSLTAETTDLLQAWRRCAVEVVDLETYTVASWGLRMNLPVIVDLVISDQPLAGSPLWSSETLPQSVRSQAAKLVLRRLQSPPTSGDQYV